MPRKQRDNTTEGSKIALRRGVLSLLSDNPFIVEAYAGLGRLYSRCYLGKPGACVDKDESRVEALACDRPEWITICGDNAALLKAGLLSDRAVDLWDLDAYGSPLHCTEGILSKGRTFPAVSFIVATDGIGHDLRGRLAFPLLRPYVQQYGQDWTRHNYQRVLSDILDKQAEGTAVKPSLIKYYQCGANKMMAHWVVRLDWIQ